MKYPVVTVVLLYFTGLFIAEFLQPALPLLFGTSIVVALAAIFISRLRSFLIWPLIVLTGWTNLVYHTAVISPNDLRVILDGAYEEVVVRGVLTEKPDERVSIRDEQRKSRTIASVDVTELKRDGTWQPAAGRIVVSTLGTLNTNFFAGQRVEIAGIISFPPTPIAEGLFDYRNYLRRQGIYFQLRATSANDWLLVPPRLARRPVSDRFLAWAQSTLARGLPVEDQPLHLLWAMTLGWRNGIANEIYEPFMESGTMHIFAISGLHIALIAGILVAVTRVVRIPRFWCGFVVIPLIWFYTAATGWQPSAIRSTIMMSIVIGGWALKRPGNLLNSLAVAAFVILLWQPQQVFQASFQLSFFVVLSIALFVPPLEKLRDRLMKTDPMRPAELLPAWQRLARSILFGILTAAVTSLAAWLGSLPWTAYYFHLFSPVTLPTNLLVVPLSSLALASNLGALFCGSWFPWATELFNHSAWFWMWLMVQSSHRATELPGAFFHVGPPTPADFVIYYAVLFGALTGWFFTAKRRIATVSVLVLVVGFYFYRWNVAQNSTTVTVIPMHGGHCTFVDAPGRENDLLIDCGNTNSVKFVLLPFLHAHGVDSIPRLLLTHGDLRDMGSAEPLCDLMHVGSVVTSNVRFRSPTYRHFLDTLTNHPDFWQAVNPGDEICGWKVLHPDTTDKFSQADDASLVLIGKFHNCRVLLLSDLGKPGQNTLMERYDDLRADIVVSGLPEQGEPLSDALLERVQPKVIIVADSEFPATKRAKLKLRERLERKSVPIIYTRFAGAVKITASDRGWELQSAYGGRIASDALPIVSRKAVETDDDDGAVDFSDEH